MKKNIVNFWMNILIITDEGLIKYYSDKYKITES